MSEEFRRRMDELSTGAPDPDDQREQVLTKARRRARMGMVMGGGIALAVSLTAVLAVGAVLNLPRHTAIGPAPSPTGTVVSKASRSGAAPVAATGEIAFWSDSMVGGSAHLMLIEADGTRRHELGHLSISTSRVSWSPDGTQAVFDHGISEGKGQLETIQEATGGMRPIFAEADPQAPDWSPNGQRIVFATDSATLFTMPAAGATSGTPVREPAPGEFLKGSWPTWSPDGAAIAYVDDRGDVRVVDVDGSAPPITIFDVGRALSLDWGDIGIVVSAFTSGSDASLYLVDPSGARSPQQLTQLPGDEFDPSISPDGGFVAFGSNDGEQTDIYVLDIATGAVDRLTDDARQDRSPAWRPTS